MKSLIVGASKEIEYGCKLLRQENISSLAIDGNKKAEGFNHSENHLDIDISNENKCIQVAKDSRIDFILPVPIGRFITTWGAINDELNLKGISKEMARICTDKWEFHQILNHHNLRNAQAYLIDNSKVKFPKLTFPMILKPRFGSGSRGVKIIQNEIQLQNNIKDIDFQNNHFVLETAVPGVEFGIDALVIDGQFKMALLREKINTPQPNRQAIGYFSQYDPNRFTDLHDRIERKIKTAIKCLGLNNCLMHADVMVNTEDEFIIELSPRPSGHNLHNNFTIKVTGYDMLKEYIKFQKNEKYTLDIPSLKNMALLYFDFENIKFINVPTGDELMALDNVVDAKVNIKNGDIRKIITQGSDVIDDGFVIIEGTNREELLTKYEEIKGMFKVEVLS